MGVDRVELERRLDPVGAGTLGEAVRVLSLRVARRGLDQQRRQAGEVRGQGADDGIVGRVPAEVRVDVAADLLEQHRDLLVGGGQRREHRAAEIDPGAEQQRPARERQVLLLEAQQERHHQATARRVAGQDHLLGRGPGLEHPLIRAARVLEIRGEGMLGGEAELGRQDARAGGDGQRADQRLVAEGRSHHVPAPVEVEERRERIGVRGQLERRHAAGVDRGDRHLRRRCELGVELLVGVALRLQPAVRDRDREQRRPQLRQPPGELAPDREGHGDRLVDVGQEPPGPVEQRLARDRQLDAVGGAAQEIAAQQLLEPADLPAEGGLGEVQAVGRAPEVELLGDGDERPQVTQLDRVGRLGEGEDWGAVVVGHGSIIA